ncbi:hypothetical protein BO70DRAFT_433003 [Aspergillus heteromorphus CBS 117.55]|uniref:Solid-state culture expressed protein n=1 Tax=Aspergillus heteromorphus CBS 117.55 TaxID=1448321 RepID=A0A317V305_9EURO|nr:uncharacterized protein BO70DRAFT_433003 [Aspergillus heteromorphus CBS 117.55]PWY67182.1 hypothetical protein BO70DRAFT_433003 [Aspergillus heteromorphus CBS 117.55]
MDTLNRTFNNASNAMWSDLHSNRTPDQLAEPHGDEPLSGIQGKGTATDPYDAGNREDQPGAPTTRENTAVIPESLASTNDDHARNPKSPSNADLGPKNVFIDEPRQEPKMGYPMGGTASIGSKQRQSQTTGVPEQRNPPSSTYSQGSQPAQKGKDLAGSSAVAGGAYGYSGQGGQDTLAVRDNLSSQKDKELPGQSSTSGGRGAQSMTDNQGAKSLPNQDDSISPLTTEGVDEQAAQTSANDTQGLRHEKESVDKLTSNPSTSEATGLRQQKGSMSKEGEAKSKLDDKASQMQQKEKSSTDKATYGGAGGIVDSTKQDNKDKPDEKEGSASQGNQEKEQDSAEKTKKTAESNGVSEEALKGPQTPAPREPFEFEKRMDEGGKAGKEAGGNEGRSDKSKGSSSSHHSHNPMTQLKEKVDKILHHNKS